MAFSYEERLLVTTSKSSPSSSSSKNVKTVRLESLTEWNDNGWVHPFSDIDINLISRSNGIKRVHMSIASHPTNRYPSSPSAYSFGLDGIPLLIPNNNNYNTSDTDYLVAPQGFFLSIEPRDGLTPKEEAAAIQTLFEDLLQRRLITTPVTGAKWDVVPSSSSSSELGSAGSSPTKNLYQIILPFNTAAFSMDALGQSFRTTLPDVCSNDNNDDTIHNTSVNNKFFGWTALEWSNYLVGEYGSNVDDNQIHYYPTYNKIMWWTWKSSIASQLSSSSLTSKTNWGEEKSLSFGIQYQTFVPSTASSSSAAATAGPDHHDDGNNTDANNGDALFNQNWLPRIFFEISNSCPIGTRKAFLVNELSQKLNKETRTTSSAYQLEPLLIESTTTTTRDDNSSRSKSGTSISNAGSHNKEEENVLLLPRPTFPYEVSVDQVLRRHHTNYGRFESVIDLTPLFDHQNNYFLSLSCRMKYRQVLPDFLSPMWRSLEIVNGDATISAATSHSGNDHSTQQLQASVEWNDQSSILYVEALAGPQSTTNATITKDNKGGDGKATDQTFLFLPSSIGISFEYGPSFLTVDDFPGDPNRGRELPPAHVTVRCDSPRSASTMTHPRQSSPTTDPVVTVYSNSLILLPPVPDMSMPFNVISLTSSLMAYVAGAIITILVRKASERIKYKLYPERKPLSPIQKLKNKLNEKLSWLKGSKH